MKKKILKRIALLLLLVTVLSSFASCKNDNGDTSTPTLPPATTASDVEANTGETDEYDPGNVNFGGYDFKMLVQSNEKHYTLHVYEGTNTPTQVTDTAIWQREHLLKSAYGVNLVMLKPSGDVSLATMLRNNAGQDSYDIVMPIAESVFTFAQEDLLLDINKLPNLNLQASYWDQRIQEDYKIMDSLYCIEGDFNFADDLATYVYIYNDFLYNQYGYYDTYGSPYELVSNGGWTVETLKRMIKDKSAETGEGVWNERDTYGYIAECAVPYYLLHGAGIKQMSNQNGELILNINDSSTWERIYETLNSVSELVYTEDSIVPGRPGEMTSDGQDFIWSAVSDIFKYDRALFRSTTLSAVIDLQDMKSDYGILPVPNNEEGSTEYYSLIRPDLHYPMTFPSSLTDVDKTTQIAELYAYVSANGPDSLRAAFFDVLADARLCRTANDVEMLELVFANKAYDLDDALLVTDLHNAVSNAVAKKANLADCMGEISSKCGPANKESMITKLNSIVKNLLPELSSDPG